MIPLKETEFDFDAINTHIIGAGILPVSVDDHGHVRLLLGKERYINHWRGSLKWSGFEGGRKTGEQIEHTAAREFVEESIGVVSIDGCAATIDSVERFVNSNQYVARIVLCITHGDNAEKRYHVTYLVQVPYDKEYTTKFTGRRRNVIDLQAKCSIYQRLTEQLKEHVGNDLPIENEVFESTCVETIRRIEVISDTIMLIEYLDNMNNSHVHEFANIPKETREIYAKWMESKRTFMCLCDHLKNINIEAVTILRDKNGFIRNAVVNEDFIEKQYVQWWSIKELRTVLQNGGYINSEFFRAYFLPVLQRAIQELDRIVDTGSISSSDQPTTTI